jgi:outer membrane protein
MKQTGTNDHVFRADNAWRPALYAVLVLVFLSGCASKEHFYNDIRRDRAISYQRWSSQRAGNSQSPDLIRGKLSPDECIEIALARNKRIKAVLFDKENARGVVTESLSEALPKIDVTGDYTRLDETPSVNFGGTSIPLGSANNYALTGRLSQPLFRGGSISAGIRAAKLYACMTDENIRTVVQSVIFDVRKTYYDVLLARELLEVGEEAVALSRRHVTAVQNRRQQGVASDYDVLRAKVEVSNYEAEMIQARNRLHLLKTSLYKLMGASQESRIELTGELRYEPLETSIEEAVQKAFADRPELLQAELQHRLYREKLIAAKAKRWPQLDLFFEENYARPDPHDSTRPSWDDSWTAGATMSFPLFDGLSTRGKIRQAKADLAKSRVELADSEEAVLLEVTQAALNIRDAESFVQSQQANVDRAAQGLKLVQAGYREGVNTDLEVRDARQALLRAKALYHQAAHQHKVAVLGFEKATGSLEPTGGTTNK